MTVKKPLVMYSGQAKELASTDSVAGVTGADQIVWLKDYAHTLSGLNAAIAANPSAVVDFRITEPLSITLTGNLTIPANMRTKCEGNGKITVAGGYALTINGWQPHDLKQYFFAATTSDRILLGTGATPVAHFEWWGGTGTGSDDNHPFTQWHASGGPVKQITQSGPYYCTNQSLSANTAYFGSKFTKLRNTAPGGSNPIWKIPAGISDVEVAGFWFDLQSSTTARGLELQVTAGGASKFNIDAHHNYFSSTATNALAPLALISSGSNGEQVEVWIEKNGFQTDGSGAYAVYVNSTNTKIRGNNNVWFAGVGSNFLEAVNIGWSEWIENDGRGPAGANYDTGVSETFNRTLTQVSVASGGRLLTALAGSEFVKEDEGQKVTSSVFNSYIELVVDPLHAYISSSVAAASATFTNGSVTVYRQTDPTGLANIMYHFKGDRGVTTIKSPIDEGVCHSAKVDSGIGKANSPINILGGQIQGRLTSDSTQEFNFVGTEMYSHAIRQAGGVGPVLNGSITALCTTLYRGVGSFNGFRVLAEGQPIGNNISSFETPNLTVLAETNAFSITPRVYLKNPIVKGVLSGGNWPADTITIKGSTHATKTAAYVIIQPDGGFTGFGTSAPGELIHAYNSTSCKIFADSPSASNSQFRLGADGFNVWSWYRPNGSTDSRFFDQTGDRIWLVQGGSVGFGASPNANALLDLTSTTKAFMPPRMTTTQKNAIASPTAGMTVYDTTLGALCIYTTSWITLNGTVTSVTSADGNATVANQTTTPVITIVSAPKWATPRTFDGVSVDGTANVTIVAPAIHAASSLTATAADACEVGVADSAASYILKKITLAILRILMGRRLIVTETSLTRTITAAEAGTHFRGTHASGFNPTMPSASACQIGDAFYFSTTVGILDVLRASTDHFEFWDANVAGFEGNSTEFKSDNIGEMVEVRLVASGKWHVSGNNIEAL